MPVPLYRLKIALLECEPLIWRRVVVKQSITGRQLHNLVQAAMGWRGYHLYEIQARGRRFGELNPYGFDDGVVAATSVRLYELLQKPGDRLSYVYDFRDEWWHEVTLEEMPRSDLYRTVPRCLEGERACPTENTGGAEEFMRYLRMLEGDDPEARETAHIILERNFVPDRFNLATVNARLRRAFR